MVSRRRDDELSTIYSFEPFERDEVAPPIITRPADDEAPPLRIMMLNPPPVASYAGIDEGDYCCKESDITYSEDGRDNYSVASLSVATSASGGGVAYLDTRRKSNSNKKMKAIIAERRRDYEKGDMDGGSDDLRRMSLSDHGRPSRSSASSLEEASKFRLQRWRTERCGPAAAKMG